MKSTGLLPSCRLRLRRFWTAWTATLRGITTRSANWATILDPLADKLLLVSGIVALSFNHGPSLGQIPLWLTGTIIGRDLLMLIGMVVIQLTVGKVIVQSAHHRQMRHGAANGRGHLDFAEMGPGFERRFG